MMSKNVRPEFNRPVIESFRKQISWGNLVQDCYIEQIFKTLKKPGKIEGISGVSSSYYNKNVILTGPAGSGKTAAFMRLYLKDEESNGLKYSYVSASIFIKKKNCLKEYEKTVRKAIETGTSIESLILLDDLEEEYTNNYLAASELLKKIGNGENHIWVACRPEFLDRLDSSVDEYFDEIIEICPWKDYRSYIDQYIRLRGLYNIREHVDSLIRNSVTDRTLLYSPLYVTMLLFIASDDGNEYNIRDEYDLIETFISIWIEREKKRYKSKKRHQTYVKEFRKIALDTYMKKYPKLPLDDGVMKGLLKISSKRNNRIEGFYHREFLIYFIVDGMLEAALKNRPDNIVYWFSQTFYDDVTNLCKVAMKHLKHKDSLLIYNNLFSIYRQSYEEKYVIEKTLRKMTHVSNELAFLKLRDELLYFIMRLPGIDFSDFVNFVKDHINTDCLLSLGLAYGLAENCRHPYTLAFARKLIPGLPEEQTNRAWGVCYFGDVFEDGYTYIDNQKCSWEKVRKAKLKRISANTEKAYRYRILDIPLLYCYYASREWKDCISFHDYKSILGCDLSGEYTDGEREFIFSQKEQLVDAYRSQLLSCAINKYQYFKANWLNFKSERVNGVPMIEIDEKTEKQIIELGQMQEDVNNNLKQFWHIQGKEIVEKYKDKLNIPGGKALEKRMLNKKLKMCKVLILTANYVEGTIVTQCLKNHNGVEKLDHITEDNLNYQFSEINGYPIVHVWPQKTASFTVHGSFQALRSAFVRFKPQYVFSVGVAFGADANNQNLGDVLVADHLVFYDSFNKITDGEMSLSPDEVQAIGDDILAGCQFLKSKNPPAEAMIGSNRWYLGPLLTGGTVLSDSAEKKRLIVAAEKMSYNIIGGEMEGSGVYYACSSMKPEIPFTIIKGICDWAVNKNGWDFASEDKEERENIKNCVQAFACENAFNVLRYILSQISY